MTGPARLEMIRTLAYSPRVRSRLRLVFSAPLFVVELLQALDAERVYWRDQLTRRDGDLRAMEGRLAVAMEGAARNGFRQGRDVEAGFREAGIDVPFALEEALAAGRAAQPREVTGEATLRRAGQIPFEVED